MHTEEEALKRWCPFSRKLIKFVQGGNPSNLVGGVAANRNNEDYPVTACIGSNCMAWRWGHVRETNRDDPNALPAGHPATLTDVNIVGTNRVFLPAMGYCGLAGEP